jgi:hypothetical protein
MFEGGLLVTSPLVGMTISKVGKKNYILIGYAGCIAASTGFGLLSHVQNE